MTNSICFDKSVAIEVRDSTILKADIYRLDDGKKHPAILIRTPYSRPDAENFNFNYLPLFDTLLAGYAVVIQSQRGTSDSGGKQGLGDILLTMEGIDGYDTVEWVANQSWCNGNVGTAGGSYMGLNQWITARENPPNLKAISPWVSGSGGTEPSRHNGIVNLGVALNWILKMIPEAVERQEKQGKHIYSSKAKKLLSQGVASPEEVYNFLPLKEVPHFDLEGLKEIWTNRILNTNQDTPEYYEKTRTPYEKVKVPCLHLAGWYDFYPNGTFNHYLSMREKGGSKLAREGQHIIMGPWLHSGPGVAGDISCGPLATARGSRLGERILSFYDKYLMGKDIELPAVQYFVMGRNSWRNADTWPLPQTQWQRFFLHSRGQANSSAGDGVLSRKEPGSEPPDIFIYNPHFPVPTVGCRGHWQLLTIAPSPQEQSSVERRKDVLCYTSPELSEDLEVTGPLLLHLFASTSARDTDFSAKLVDVYPDGRSYNVVCDGIIRARYRKSLFEPEYITPGEVNEYIINLEAVSQLFRKGHRIRIDISSSSFPEYDRNMNTGNNTGEDEQGIPAMQSIYHQSEYPSYINLPVID
ncbi:CocE/NonD family hydrolase [Thermodesulfobacteriota bacterium]